MMIKAIKTRNNGGLHPIIDAYFNHHIGDKEKIIKHIFLDDYVPPMASLLSQIDNAKAIIEKHALEGGRIVVFGDYDVDGITSSAIVHFFMMHFKKFFPNLNYQKENVLFPNRNDGYGLKPVYAKKILHMKPSLVICVDNGSTAFEAINMLRENMVDVVVLDHHHLKEEMPNANAIVNPHLNNYPNPYLSGSATTYKTLSYIMSHYDDKFMDDYVWLCGLGLAADVMPLSEIENRYWIYRAMKTIQNAKPISILLNHQKAWKISNITYRDFGFTIAPPFNACGRMGNVELAFNFITSDDTFEMLSMANKIYQYNDERKFLMDKYSKIGINDAKVFIDNNQDVNILLIETEAEAGIIGLIASAISNAYNLPAFVYRISNNVAHGSLRAPISNYAMIDVMDRISHLFLSYGGHNNVAGFSFAPEDTETIYKELNNLAGLFNKEHGEYIRDIIAIDIPLAFITYNTYKIINHCEPLGDGTLPAITMTSVVSFRNISHINNRHSAGEVFDNGIVISFIMWNNVLDLDIDMRYRIAYNIEYYNDAVRINILRVENE